MNILNAIRTKKHDAVSRLLHRRCLCPLSFSEPEALSAPRLMGLFHYVTGPEGCQQSLYVTLNDETSWRAQPPRHLPADPWSTSSTARRVFFERNIMLRTLISRKEVKIVKAKIG